MTSASCSWRRLDASHAAELTAINRACPLQSAFTFRFDRDPDFFAWPRLVFEKCNYFGLFDGERIVGYCMAGFRSGWTGEQFSQYGYVGDFRLLPAYRGRGFVASSFAHVLAAIPTDVRAGFCLVARGNRAAERVMQRADVPGVTLVEAGGIDVVNIPIIGAPRIRHDVAIREARDADVNALADLLRRSCKGQLFSPRHDDSEVARRVHEGGVLVAESASRVVGVIAWTQLTPVRRTTILRFPPSYLAVRLGWRVIRTFAAGMTAFPAPGEALRSVIVTDFAAEDHDRSVLRALMRRAMAAQLGRGVHALQVCGTPGDHVLQSLAGLLRFSFESNVWLLYRGDAPAVTRPPYLDLRIL